ncbi:MAG: biotin--[Erysipelotrichaceae bacterium]|nr:biotin--[acetyl-CoA-carboxylase] ligase [Erysipelotrichaceae bacterium]
MKEIHFREIDSTNTYLKENYASVSDLTIVSADYQSSGKGRNQRVWDSKPGENLLFSLLIKDSDYFPLYKAISIVSAYSVMKTLNEYGIEDTMIKWPNDIYVRGQKICGILLESVSRNEIECLIIGIGINVNQQAFGTDYIHPPVSMRNILNKETDMNEFKVTCFSNLLSDLEKLKDGYDYYPEISRYDYLRGQKVFHEGKEYTVEGINEDYTLKLSHDGQERNVEAGEISFHS